MGTTAGATQSGAYAGVIMELRAAMRSGGLAWAALGMLDRPSSAGDLARRFEAEGAVVSADRAAELLAQLTDLGLAWIADAEGSQPRYVRAPVGDQVVASGIADGGDVSVRLAEIERLRSNLFTTVAHELRTPLTAIRTAVGLLLDPDTRAEPGERHLLLETVERNAERLQRLADGALELARFHAGEVRLQRRRFDARELGDEVRLALGPLLDTKQQQLVVATGARAVWVFADHRRIERAIVNLVSNAHKFSPERAEIRLSISRNGEDVRWEVADDGPGIPLAEQTRLFERFFVSASARAAGGSGLGLSIVQATAQAHGGRVEVESEVGRGSAFRFIIPAAPPKGDDS
jgi:signal transduction histidine kinase